MRLSECLNHASISTLQAIAQNLQLSCTMYSKLDLVQSILESLRNPLSLAEQLDQWHEEWGVSLRRIALHRRNVFAKEEIEHLLASAGHDTVNGLQKALAQGWLFLQNDSSRRRYYIVPKDIQMALRDDFQRRWRAQVRVRTDDPLVQVDEGMAALHDLHTLLQYVQQREVRLTASGAMYKRHVQQLMELFEVEESIELPQWRFGYGRRTYDYPDRLALLYDFAYDEGIVIERQDERLTVDPARLSDFLTLGRKTQLRRLLQFYVRTYRRPIPRLYDIMETIRLLADVWTSNTSLYAICAPQIQAFYYDQPTDVWDQRVVKMLVHLGVARIGYDDDSGERWFQITKLGQELLTQDEADLPDELTYQQAALVVQPNFEIVVMVPDARMEAQIAEFAELKSSGALRVYRILDRTVERGLSLGRDFEAWRALLATRGMAPIPVNVDRMLAEWVGRGGVQAAGLGS
ncbi:Helicase conserved C-terminal domain-containing protein [Alicyclobacillus hesperidum]|uniref:Helicase conserved C-terminal domain-containing protein n=1 Tax=Alicyclobacillus hesperidum TaxID=89784 RepID=A0A1H2WR02_9BACL|nr:helicase-associated domain-containing protein [Alicyclobacillus hesperidum]SDW82987.1 Helicase conserved C-terminal domain-containing protein [Alicyclobacillus hesperidum]